ncbi:MAG TPA: hypothetical protein VFE50_22815 [Cyclobacteriaceae bacterium]|nr:hypothetical protein [Cyclobacteriaceae bacterium]
MKKIFGLLLLTATAFQCSDLCTLTNTYYYSVPEYMSFADLRSSVKPEAPRELSHAGKIYFKDDFLYITEVGEGIHVIDNRNPSKPVHKSFIRIPGNNDLAIFGNVLYADSYVDLVAIDVSTPGQEREVTRYNNMFNSYSDMHLTADPDKGVIVKFNVAEQKTIRNECSGIGAAVDGWGYYGGGILMNESAYASSIKYNAIADAGASSGTTSGVGGSMARFTITSDRLYVLNGYKLNTIDITDPSTINLKSSTQVAGDIETIFPYKENLFLGSRTGMYILGLDNPDEPNQISMFSHLKSCDPVVVEGDYAYVTLRSANTCNGTINELQVIDVSKVTNPRLVRTYQMTNPHGLGIDNGTLFICDGDDGLKVYDATDVNRISDNMTAHYDDIHAFDVIPFNNIAMLIGEDGLYQYDYSDIHHIKLLSKFYFEPRE